MPRRYTRKTGRRRTSYKKPVARRASSYKKGRKSARRSSPQRITLVIKHEPPSTSMNAPMLGLEGAPQAIKKAMF